MSLGHKNRRRSVRLTGHNYGSCGFYFITICAYRKWSVFGVIIDGVMQLNQWGIVVRDEWLKTGDLRDHITLDEFVIMPNHCHGIIVINANARRGTARCAPTNRPSTNHITTDYTPTYNSPTIRQFGSMISGSIPAIVRAFKSAVTLRINRLRHSPGVPVWQRNYYEHIIRTESELNQIRQYIRDNPKNWGNDELFV